jgi:hypothetical protein
MKSEWNAFQCKGDAGHSCEGGWGRRYELQRHSVSERVGYPLSWSWAVLCSFGRAAAMRTLYKILPHFERRGQRA